MARKTHSVAAETLEELQSSADQLADWIRENMLLVFGAVGGLLAAAGVASYLASARGQNEDEASAALFAARSDYMAAMGTHVGAFEVPELANPEAATGIRNDFAADLRNIASEHPGTTVEFLAQLEAGLLKHEEGDAEGALAIYAALADANSQTDALQGLAMQRAAQVLEDLNRFGEAADRHEAAAALEGYPLRYWALADAARTRAAAGEPARALELYDRLEEEAPQVRLPEPQRSQAQELRALAESSSAGSRPKS